MSNENDEKSFWATIPGILTGLAALITAIGGIWLIFNPTVTPGAPPEIATPDIVFEAPDIITIGDFAILSWTVTKAERFFINGEAKPFVGIMNISPKETIKYNFTAINKSNKVSKEKQVIVVAKSEIQPPLISYFDADPSSIYTNENATLRWATSNAQTISIDNGIGDVEPNGKRSISPTSTTIYTLIAENQKDTASQSTTVTVNKPLTSYWITIKTGTGQSSLFDGGGTSGYVNLTLHGEYGEVSTGTLDNPGENFEQGKVSRFELKDVIDVGNINRIEIHFIEKGDLPDWRVDWITIKNAKTAKTYVFSIYEWLKQSATFTYSLTRTE